MKAEFTPTNERAIMQAQDEVFEAMMQSCGCFVGLAPGDEPLAAALLGLGRFLACLRKRPIVDEQGLIRPDRLDEVLKMLHWVHAGMREQRKMMGLSVSGC